MTADSRQRSPEVDGAGGQVSILWHLHGPNHEHCWCEMVDIVRGRRLIRIATDHGETSAELHQSALHGLTSAVAYAEGLILNGWRE